jgi:hypothetical protein
MDLVIMVRLTILQHTLDMESMVQDSSNKHGVAMVDIVDMDHLMVSSLLMEVGDTKITPKILQSLLMQSGKVVLGMIG